MVKMICSKAIVVEIDGVQCAVLRAQEDEKGIVRITPYTPINLEDGDDNLLIKEQHLSAYPNENSGSVHLHHTYKVDHPEVYKIDYSHITKRVGESFAQAAMAMSVPLKFGRVADVIKPKYEVKKIPSYKTRRNMLVLCYSVSSLDADFPNLYKYGIDLLELKFSKFKIGLYYTYVNIPSYFRGWVSSISTSTPRVNDGEVVQFNPTRNYDGGELRELIMMNIRNAIDGSINQINSDAEKLKEYDPDPVFIDRSYIMTVADPDDIVVCYMKIGNDFLRMHVLKDELQDFELT